LELPVSKMTVNFCAGMPTPISPKYCAFMQFLSAMTSESSPPEPRAWRRRRYLSSAERARGDAVVLVDGLLFERHLHQALRRRRHGEEPLEQHRHQEHQGDAAGSHGRDLEGANEKQRF
jgi:hypothetical protein